jgi:hypothetical protein
LDEIHTLAREDARDAYRQFLAQHGAPAYVRRALQVEEAFEQLVRRCQQQRDEWLLMVRLRLAMLRALAGDWAILRPSLADDEQVRVLNELWEMLQPTLRLGIAPTSSVRKLRRALAELNESIELFNSRWQAFLAGVDLGHVNALRDGYNRYYLLEKECAMRSPRLARQGFKPMAPLTTDDLARVLPLLPVSVK